MKKIIASLLILVMAFTMLAGCGSKSSPAGKPSVAAEGTDNGTDSSKPDKEIPGTELSTFMSKYVDAKTKNWDNMTAKFEEEKNNAFAMGSLGFVLADLAILEIAFFDTLTADSNGVFKGTLALSGIEAWKKVNGDIIEFGYDYTYTEDKNQIKKGDREVANGKFDKTAGSLFYEHYGENNGVKNNKVVVEITRNSDSSYSSQIYSIDAPSTDNKATETLNGYFTWFEGENIKSVFGERENADFNFTFNSIFGKKNIKPEEMANGMTIKMKTSFTDGKALFEDLSAQ